MEKWLMLLCLMRSENVNDLKICREEYIVLAEAYYNEGLDAVCDICKYGKELATQHLELISKFGRNPFRNSILKRDPTVAETDYIFGFLNEQKTSQTGGITKRSNLGILRSENIDIDTYRSLQK